MTKKLRKRRKENEGEDDVGGGGDPGVVTGSDRSDRWPVNIGRNACFGSDRLVTGTALGSDR